MGGRNSEYGSFGEVFRSRCLWRDVFSVIPVGSMVLTSSVLGCKSDQRDFEHLALSHLTFLVFFLAGF
jgi:hypothetical protein